MDKATYSPRGVHVGMYINHRARHVFNTQCMRACMPHSTTSGYRFAVAATTVARASKRSRREEGTEGSELMKNVGNFSHAWFLHYGLSSNEPVTRSRGESERLGQVVELMIPPQKSGITADNNESIVSYAAESCPRPTPSTPATAIHAILSVANK